MTKVADLFEGLDCTIIGDASEEVAGLAYSSTAVEPGDIFFCIVGFTVDGHSFAQDAVNRGAKVLVVERKLYLVETDDVTLVVVDDSRKAMAHVAARFYAEPSKALKLVGITGTNGKTTTTYLVEQIARVAGYKTGVIGTVGVQIGDKRERAQRTTPESPDLQATLSRMRDAGCQVAAMEVSSHALDLQRCWQTKFEVTAFTNLTQDHLDYHHTFEDYFEAKARLFTSDYQARRVICIDDRWGRELEARCREAGDDVLSCGFSDSADIHPVQFELAANHTQLTLAVCGQELALDYPLVGRFNVSNVMCAFAIAQALGISEEAIVKALSSSPQVPGRLERVEVPISVRNKDKASSIAVFVDYAHTPDALEKAISSLRFITKGRVIVVFGCGGDRDASKRSIMGQEALKADIAVVTSDNPRSENPDAIIADILSGMGPRTERYEVVVDRREAIARAISLAQAQDSILIAGKGHEDYQILGDTTIHFDDREVAAEELARAFEGE